MYYILLAPFVLVLADLLWITFNTHYGIYSHLRIDQKLFFSITAPFKIPVSVSFRSPDLPLTTTLICAFFGWAGPFLYLLLKLDTSKNSSIQLATLEGLELGAIVYVVFNATSYLTFPAWRRWIFNTIPIAVIDTLWGCALYSASSALAYELAQW